MQVLNGQNTFGSASWAQIDLALQAVEGKGLRYLISHEGCMKVVPVCR